MLQLEPILKVMEEKDYRSFVFLGGYYFKTHFECAFLKATRKYPEGPLTPWWFFPFPHACQNSRGENPGKKRNTAGCLLPGGLQR